MQEITTEGVQYLPIHCIENDEDYYIVNVTNIVDCFDYERAEFDRYENSGRIMWFKKYSFIPEKLQNLKLFKLIDEPQRDPFVTEEFMNKIEEKNLTGFKLKLVWDSDNI